MQDFLLPDKKLRRQPALESLDPARPRQQTDPQESQLFTGSSEAVERSRAFTGPGDEVFEDRDKTLSARN